MKRSTMIPVVLVALVAMAILAPTVQAKGGTRIVLNPTSSFSGTKGSAKHQAAGQRELEVELEHVRRLAGKRVSFFVNSTKIGSSRSAPSVLPAWTGGDRPSRRSEPER